MTEINNVGALEFLRNRLGSLSHPSGEVVKSVLGATDTLPPGQQEAASKAADKLVTGIVHTLEEDFTLVRNDQYTALRNQATEVDESKPIHVTCNSCGGMLFDLSLSSPQSAQTSGALLRKHFRGTPTEGCVCE